MQVEIDVKCLETNFGGWGLSSFGDFAPFCLPSKMAKIPFQAMDYTMESKIRICSYLLTKFMQLEFDEVCTNFFG